MRTTLYAAALIALAAAPACKWTEFDDLEGETWVTATDKPNGDSTDYGVAMVRGKTSGDGATLVVFGAGEAQFTELVYSANGDVDVAPTLQNIYTLYAIGTLDPQPIVLASPVDEQVALVTPYSSQSIAVLRGTHKLNADQVFGATDPVAATYMLPPPSATQTTPGVQVLVASPDAVWGFFDPVNTTPNPQPKCQLVDEAAMPIAARGLGATRLAPSTSDDVVVWGVPTAGGMGKLMVYPGSVFAGCATPQAPIAGWTAGATTFAPTKGSQLIMVDATHVLAVGHKEVGNTESYLGLFRIDASAKAITMVGAPVTLPDLRTAAILDVTTGATTKKYVVAGYPTALVDGVRAGQVAIFALDLTTGISSTPDAILHDAQPEEEQQFGRAVAVTPMNGKPAIAVAADNEIFMYFKTNLYEETRTGR